MNKNTGKNNVPLFLQIVDYYSTTDKYIRSRPHSNAHQNVYTKENDRYQWLVLEEKSQSIVEARQIDRQGKIVARDSYEFARRHKVSGNACISICRRPRTGKVFCRLQGNVPKCVGEERLCEGANFHIAFSNDETGIIYQFGERGKAETCDHLSAVLPQIQDGDTKRIVGDTLEKLDALSAETCVELTATTKRRKATEHEHSIRARLAKPATLSRLATLSGAKEQAKQPTVAEGKRSRTHGRRKGDRGL